MPSSSNRTDSGVTRFAADFLLQSITHTFYYLLLDQDVPHGLDVLVAVIWTVCCLVSTRVGVITPSSSTKPDSGVTGTAVVLLVTNNTDSCFGITHPATYSVEAFLVTVELQGGLRAN